MTSQKIMQPKIIKSQNNGCGTAPGNLALLYFPGTFTAQMKKLLQNKDDVMPEFLQNKENCMPEFFCTKKHLC
jgi:hypothetical protein